MQSASSDGGVICNSFSQHVEPATFVHHIQQKPPSTEYTCMPPAMPWLSSMPGDRTASTVPRRAETGIDVLVVGAGVGGLTAALECWRKGHNVHIFERTAGLSTAGDMFTIGISARRWIRNWPEMQRELDHISFSDSHIGFYKHTGEEIIPSMPMSKLHPKAPDMAKAQSGGPPMAIQSRPLFHQMLYRQIQRIGIPVTYSKRAVEYWEDIRRKKGFVKTDDGSVAEADIIIAADGIRSKSQKLIHNESSEAKSTGLAVYRAAFPLDIALADPAVKEHLNLAEGGRPMMRHFYGPNTNAIVFVHKGEMIWLLNHPDRGDARESWNEAVSNSDVLCEMSKVSGWDPKLKAMVNTTPKGKIINWRLVWRNPQSQWTSPGARILQLGDAAHSFLPSSGNGATQAIEDAVSIACCLELAGKRDVPLAARVHNKLRFERVSCVQLIGFINTENFHRTDWEEAAKNPHTVRPKVPRWIFMHDPETYAYDNYDKVAADFTGTGGPFENTNIPPGYTYKPWTMDEIQRNAAVGKRIFAEGDWS